jgi:hypothetical protein
VTFKQSATMNIYICSTVRHLLFSICRGVSKKQQEHHILFFSDYQQAPFADWNFADLPDTVHVYELNRKDFRSSLEKLQYGHICYWIAMRKLRAPGFLKKPVLTALANFHPELANKIENTGDLKLWLFNERNKMARIFRLLTESFSLIEEGEGNYKGKLLPWRKRPGRILQGQPAKQWLFGDDPRCKEILVNYPERLPKFVRHKGLRIDFLSGPEVSQAISEVFSSNNNAIHSAKAILLATQPLELVPGIQLSDKQYIYKKITAYLAIQGWQVILKAHPSEDIEDYNFLDKSTMPADPKTPIEALILEANTPIPIVSICSSAGLGFEQFCRRITFCKGDDYHAIVKMWAKEPKQLDAMLGLTLDKIKPVLPDPT